MKNFIKTLLIIFIINTIAAAPVLAEGKPSVEAQGAILMDFETGRVLWEKNSKAPMAMASTTKIMTSILALELGDVSDIVTVSRRAEIAPRVKMYLQQGEEISLEGLLLALMLQSSNDAAVAIAEHIGGSVEEFCAMMTKKALELGCEDTVFETPNGLDAGDHHSTAYDMALITRYALNNADFVRLISNYQATTTSSRTTYHISNRNRLLREFNGATGVKTGYTGKAGHCFVGSAEREQMQLISVVFASGWGERGKEQKWTDTKEILNYGFANYAPFIIINENEIGGTLNVERTKTPSIPLYYSEGITLPLNEAERACIDIEAYYPALIRAPIAADTVIGSARIYIGGEFAAEVELLTQTGAERHDLKTSLEKVIREFLKAGTTQELTIILPEF